MDRSAVTLWHAVTSLKPIVLTSASGTLTLSPDDAGVGEWCQVHLLVSGESRRLGAERLNGVAARLAAFLASPSPGERWILSLSELHTSAYGEHIGEEAIIRLQDADANWFAKLVLTSADRGQWMQQLSQHRVANG